MGNSKSQPDVSSGSWMPRVQTTVRGSADDIGWLQKDPSFPPVTDKTERFVQLLGRISRGVHVLPDSIVYLLIPGLFSNHGPLYFIDTKKYFSKLGLLCYIAHIDSEAGVEENGRKLKEYIEELYWSTGKRVLLLGHSKGGVDAAAACAMYWADLKDKVVGLVFAQSPYGGTPIASDILRDGQIADFETRRILDFIISKVIKGDIQSLEDLTYDKRRSFIAQYPLPAELLTVSFHTKASKGAGVLSTMSRIAQADIPWRPGTRSTGGALEKPEKLAGAKLPLVIPLAAAMALCALHLDVRYGEKSDGLVTRKDAEVPGSVVVRPDVKLDHSWMVFTPSRKKGKDPNASQMCEALFTLLLEEEAARVSASSSADPPLLDETSEVANSAPEMPSTEIPEGEDYLHKLQSYSYYNSPSVPEVPSTEIPEGEDDYLHKLQSYSYYDSSSAPEVSSTEIPEGEDYLHRVQSYSYYNSSSTPEVPSTEMPEGEDYLHKVQSYSYYNSSSPPEVPSTEIPEGEDYLHRVQSYSYYNSWDY